MSVMSRGNHCGSTSELGLNEGEKWNMVAKKLLNDCVCVVVMLISIENNSLSRSAVERGGKKRKGWV